MAKKPAPPAPRFRFEMTAEQYTLVRESIEVTKHSMVFSANMFCIQQRAALTDIVDLMAEQFEKQRLCIFLPA